MKFEDKLNWNLIENSNNLICITELWQAKLLLYAAIERGKNYDVEDIKKYINDMNWYNNFKNQTKIRYIDYGDKATFTYGFNQCNLNLLQFEDIFINEQKNKVIS